MTPWESELHTCILRHIVATGRGLASSELAGATGRSLAEVRAGLDDLARHHGAVLQPDGEVWIIHPFSLAPTAFWVSTARGGWWGCCTWCSLGIAAIVEGPATLRTTLGGEGEPVSIAIHGAVAPADLLVHFPIPAARAWDNVVYWCSTVLPFRSKAEIQRWSERHGIAVGAAVPIGKVWALAREWYGGYLAPEWRKHTVRDAAAIFRRVGLDGPAWELPDTADGF